MANTFEKELGGSCAHLDWEYHKIPVPKFRNMRWGKKPPYDILTSTWVSSFAIEAKSSARLESFPFARVEPHQVAGLLDHAERGWPSYVAINFRPARGLNRNIAFAITIQDFIALRESIGRKSIPREWFSPEVREPLIEIPRRKVGDKLIWDLRVLEDHYQNRRTSCQQPNTDSNRSATTCSLNSSSNRTRSPRAESTSRT